MIRRAWWSAAFVLLCPALTFGESAPPYQTDFPPGEFQARWKTIFERIGNEAIAMLQGALDRGCRAGEAPHRRR